MLKKLSNENVHYSVVAIYASYFGLPLSLFISLLIFATGVEHKNIQMFQTHMSIMEQAAYSLTSAVCGVMSQIFFNVSMRHEDASKIAIFRSTDFFFTYLFQYLWLGIATNVYSVVGASLIILGTVLILIYKIFDRKQLDIHGGQFNWLFVKF